MTTEAGWAPRRLEWSPRLAVGVDTIDAQHQELFRRVNEFLEALAARRARQEVEPLLEFLVGYAHEHFEEELKMMRLSSFPGTGEHLAEHHEFEEDLAALVEEYRWNGATLAHARKLESLLVTWLERHVDGTDRRLGEYLSGMRGRRNPVASA